VAAWTIQFTYAPVKAGAPDYERGKQRVDHLFIVLVALGLPALSERRHESVDEDARSGGHQLAARSPEDLARFADGLRLAGLPE
jgi:hypothetical protein